MPNAKSTPRSQQLRQRRSSKHSGTQNSEPRSNRRSSSKKRSAPPLLVRGELGDITMVSRQRRSTARRRYDIALNVPGAEMRLPALPAIRPGWRSLSFLLVALLAFSLYTLWNSDQYFIQEIRIEGLQHLTTQDINSLVNITGASIFTVDTNLLAEELVAAFPELYNVDIKVGLPSDVLITVEERQPVLVWTQDGRTVWVDADGIAFPPRESEPPALVVKAEGIRTSHFHDGENPNQLLNAEIVQTLLSMQQYLPEGEMLVFNEDHGLGWRERRWEVYLGMDVSNIEGKLQMYDAIVEHLKDTQVRPALISIEHIHAPYYRMEQ